MYTHGFSYLPVFVPLYEPGFVKAVQRMALNTSPFSFLLHSTALQGTPGQPCSKEEAKLRKVGGDDVNTWRGVKEELTPGESDPRMRARPGGTGFKFSSQ